MALQGRPCKAIPNRFNDDVDLNLFNDLFLTFWKLNKIKNACCVYGRSYIEWVKNLNKSGVVGIVMPRAARWSRVGKQ